MKETLIVYFSRADENYFEGKLQYIEVGNTEIVVNKILKKIKADAYKLEMKNPYSKEYNICIEEAKVHKKENARPDLVYIPDDIDAYENIILAYPNYWGTMPMAVFTFLDAFNFTGKKIFPICTNEGSGMDSSERDLSKECDGAKVFSGLSLIGSDVEKSDNEIDNWLIRNQLI